MELGVMVGALVDGLGLSAWIFVVTLVGSLPLGIVVALCRMSSFKPLSLLAQFYISILRGTPLMLQLMAFMFGPYYLLGMNMGTDWKFGACAVGFILNYSAYFAEIYRSGIQSIPKGQYEAALVLGYSRSQTFFKIVLPMITPIFFFNLINQTIGAFQAFNSSYLITQGKPLNTTLYYGVHLYNRAFTYYEMGYGSAMAWFMLLVIAAFTALIFRSSTAWVYYESEGK